MPSAEPAAELTRGLWRWTAPHPDRRPSRQPGGPDGWSWLTGVRADREELRALLAPVLEIPVARVLMSHGRPVLRGGARALEAALAP